MSLIPVSVLTGFLGSGKTTLLARALTRPELAQTAVIINEFGEVGLDHLLIARSDESIVELNSGCLCCTVRGDLVNTLGELHDKRARGLIPAFDRVVVETTGLADPAPILHTLMTEPHLMSCYRLDGVITTVDAVNGMATLDRHEEAVKQVAVADRLVITKSDLPEAQCEALSERLAGINPGARVLRAVKGELDPSHFFDAGLYNPENKSLDVRRWLAEERYGQGGGSEGQHHEHAQDHDHGHDHADVNRHDDRIRAFCITRDRPISGANFSLFLELLTANRGPDLLRMKGLVDIAERPGQPAVIHGVQHILHPVVWLDAWPDDGTGPPDSGGGGRRTRLVFITRDLPAAWVERLLDALTGQTPPGQTPPDLGGDGEPLAPAGGVA
jgi:G3E family GTPase